MFRYFNEIVNWKKKKTKYKNRFSSSQIQVSLSVIVTVICLYLVCDKNAIEVNYDKSRYWNSNSPPPPKLTPPLKFLFVIDIRVREIDYRNVTGNDKQ